MEVCEGMKGGLGPPALDPPALDGSTTGVDPQRESTEYLIRVVPMTVACNENHMPLHL